MHSALDTSAYICVVQVVLGAYSSIQGHTTRAELLGCRSLLLFSVSILNG
jgi:hypothetical protein